MRLFIEVFIYAVNILKEYALTLVELFLSRALFAIPLLIFAIFWVFFCIKKDKLKSIAMPFIVMGIICAFIWGAFAIITHDESEHLHCAWMVSKGMVPYRDFWQHHFPTMWAMLAIFMKGLKATALIFPISRILCTLLFLGSGIIGWMIARRVWGQRANLLFYLFLILSDNFLSKFMNLRPLTFMLPLLLLGVYFSMKIPEPRNAPPLFAGFFIALGLTFDAREFLFMALPVLFILLEERKWVLRRLSLYVMGVLAGISPLLIYLFRHGIIGDFVFWGLEVNYYKFNVYLAALILKLLVIGLAGWFVLRAIYVRNRDSKGLGFLAGYVLCSVAVLTFFGTIYDYYLFSPFFLLTIFLSGYNFPTLLNALKLSTIKKSLLAGLVITFIVLPSFQIERAPLLARRMEAVNKIMKLCENESCVVLAPRHPVFAYDAIGLYSQWQFAFLSSTPESKKFLTKNGIADQIMNIKPIVISHDIDDKAIFDQLASMNLMSQAENDELADFLDEQYSVREIDGEKFYIRNDRVEKGGL